MYQDVSELVDFYDTPTGIMVRRVVGREIRARWPSVKGMSLAGVGYSVPYLGVFREEAERVLAFMPAGQGVRRWPKATRNLTALVEEDQLPLPDGSMDRILAIHALEMTGDVRHVLREFWRVLTPEGRLLLVVPNRRGLWAQRESTPFGHGRPYSRGQLGRLLEGAMLSVESIGHALAVPPLDVQILQRAALPIERVGLKIWPAFAGLVVVEASKRMMGGLAVPVRGRRMRLKALSPQTSQRSELPRQMPGPPPRRRLTRSA